MYVSSGTMSPKRRRMDTYETSQGSGSGSANGWGFPTSAFSFAAASEASEFGGADFDDDDIDDESAKSTAALNPGILGSATMNGAGFASTPSVSVSASASASAASLNGGGSGSQRKRISRACDPCRRKRAKCSGEAPCSLCVNKPHLCVYAPLVRSKKEADQGGDDHMQQQQQQQPSHTSGGGMSRLDHIENRLASMERMLNRMLPLLEQSVSNASSSQQPQFQPQSRLPLPSHSQNTTFVSQPNSFNGTAPHRNQATSNLSAALNEHKPPLNAADGNNSSLYKTGGFLINTEETAMTFWGSTSALGGTSNNAHLYKAIPRFINGILMVHIPARTHEEEQRESAKNTPSGSVGSGSYGSDRFSTSLEDRLNATKDKVGSINSLVSDTMEMQDLIPLPYELIDHLLKNYWEQFHPQFPLLDKQWFDVQLQKLRTLQFFSVERHWRFMLLLTSLIALMVNFTPSLSDWQTKDHNSMTDTDSSPHTPESARRDDGLNHETILKHLLEKYKKIFFDHYEIADVVMIQSLLFMVLMGGCARGARFTGTWGYMGIAVRMAQELGLHRSIKELGVQHRTFDRESIAIRNRTWHCCMIMETYTCIWTGRPLAVQESDWDAEYPDGDSPEMVTFRHHIDLAIIIRKILRFANRAQPTDVELFASRVHARLEEWWNALDDDWRALQFTDRWNSKALMALMFHSATILFHRITYCRIDQPACLASAKAITTLVSRFQHPPNPNECIVLFPSFTYCAMMACTVHISQMLASSTNGDARRFVDAVNSLQIIMNMFDVLRSVFIVAERCWKTVLDFLTAKGIKLDELVKAAKKSAEGMNGAGEDGGDGTAETPKVAGQQMTPLTKGVDSMEISWPQSFMDASASKGATLTNPQRIQLQQLGASSAMAANNPTGGMSGSGMGLWDGLSLFDLAGLGGLGGLMDADYSMFQQALPSQPQFQNQFIQQQQQRQSIPQQSTLSQQAAVATPATPLQQLADISASMSFQQSISPAQISPPSVRRPTNVTSSSPPKALGGARLGFQWQK
ncbi:hypothetical protein HDU79_004175 [Rhizoclosmatium sp. JEL0117]|nr:hypothetical protein HDU79_004175 [Rhizoclosmatium sp. JEL0117]